ncbi:hypothetical protein SSX86_027243 [Deinandra increscens subsp. villosa]|uniref:WRKY domain-containing protein n=1 Tax=Deinandra increscens subsp. villosa TaxID=3103831 RepID=A0AAP0CMX3_9ASTR
MEVDWDLHAVVRACCSTASSSSSAPSTATTGAVAGTALSWPMDAYNQRNISFHDENLMGFFPDPFQARNDNSIEQFLYNLNNNPINFPKLQKPPQSPQSLPISPLSVLGGLQDQPLNHHHQQEQKQVQGKQQAFGISRCTTSNAQSTTRSKKRKNQMKRVCQVPAEGLSSDVWSWRKYGQKPIKGSPYPRGYYRCSTSKGCLARKQVERNRSDPDMFIVTYTGEHSHPIPTHRNSLAGSTRTKPTTSGEETKPTSSPPVSPPTTSQSPATEKAEDNDTDDDNFDMVMDDDFFEGLDELVGPSTGDNFPPASPEINFPWLSNNAATTSTTAAGGS